ncbi:hypothetical protein [Synechococcus phage BUCT-ZZ01]|nr:hypothetical protein [Synechococcus phage BUCT-ZZ01]
MPKPAAGRSYEREFKRLILENDNENYGESMKPATFDPVLDKDKPFSNLTTKQYIVTQLAATQMSIRSGITDDSIDAVIETLKRVADKILEKDK